ncbi:MBL fold metallo-hydrolase [Streptomyces sp. CB09001]|uniref:MBL fold metallo-hydrolase n=1 Tax=unclassified Streptomyces TaxID=2593676 RepID=UPI000E21A49D|nr:MBL fold metallo-hydrolase [Streptomyces sp. CB09001]AXL88824.1 MBL fold metallo-hydrolase [Streptomyces sp. CB09001]
MTDSATTGPADAGLWRVDGRCIDCDVARQLAPGNTAQRDGTTVVTRQPRTADEEAGLWRAALACPVAAVRPPREATAPTGLLPSRIEDEVYLCGYNSKETFGANAYFVRRPEGNLLIDAPRFSRAVAARYEELGGVSRILVTHRDHVPHVARYAQHFGAPVWIHEGDSASAPFATEILRGSAPETVQRGVVALPVTGHTPGSTVYLVDDRFCFTGDTLYWSRDQEDLEVFETVVWHSRQELLESVRRMAAQARFEWVLPGHGDRRRLPADEMTTRLLALAQRMRGRPALPLDIGAVRW